MKYNTKAQDLMEECFPANLNQGTDLMIQAQKSYFNLINAN